MYHRRGQRVATAVLRRFQIVILIACVLLAAACQSRGREAVSIADFGNYGRQFALRLATQHPYRSPGSAAERAAADMIHQAFQELGYQPEFHAFEFTLRDGTPSRAVNVVVKIEGKGFVPGEQAPEGTKAADDRRIIIGAHYDVGIRAEDAAGQVSGLKPNPGVTTPDGSLAQVMSVPTLADFNGIHSNAAGIGVLLTLAREMKEDPPGYDVTLVAFAAANAANAGSQRFFESLSQAELSKVDAMYNIAGIYAGDKVYAHAGQNSVRAGARKSYDLRRKLYETTDVFYNYTLNTHNRFVLYTNQASFLVDHDEDGAASVFREWTTHLGDHTPFDRAGIPIVYFESFDYGVNSLEDLLHESTNPVFGPSAGWITNTAYDSSAFLLPLFDQSDELTVKATPAATLEKSDLTPAPTAKTQTIDRLTQRINNIAFILLKAAQNGPPQMTISE